MKNIVNIIFGINIFGIIMASLIFVQTCLYWDNVPTYKLANVILALCIICIILLTVTLCNVYVDRKEKETPNEERKDEKI